MNVRQIFQGKDRFVDLLLLGDEQEDMIARYLGRGELFALYDPNLRGGMRGHRRGGGDL